MGKNTTEMSCPTQCISSRYIKLICFITGNASHDHLVKDFMKGTWCFKGMIAMDIEGKPRVPGHWKIKGRMSTAGRRVSVEEEILIVWRRVTVICPAGPEVPTSKGPN